MSRTCFAAVLCVAFAVTGCSRKTPCAKLAAEICDTGSSGDCVAFVDGEMVARHEEITDAHKKIACQLVLDDPPTVEALQRAFETRQVGSGGSEKKGSASK